jgi:hypothetical protein
VMIDRLFSDQLQRVTVPDTVRSVIFAEMHASMAEPAPATEPEPAGYTGRIDGGSVASRFYAKLATRAGAAAAALLLMVGGFSAGYLTGSETSAGAQPAVRSAALPNAPREMQSQDARQLQSAPATAAPADIQQSSRPDQSSVATDMAGSRTAIDREPRSARRTGNRSRATLPATTRSEAVPHATTSTAVVPTSSTNPSAPVSSAPPNGLEKVSSDQQNDANVGVRAKITKPSTTDRSKPDKP